MQAKPANQMKIRGSAMEYIRQVHEARQIPSREPDEPQKAGALGILESLEDTMKPPEELNIGILTGERVIRQMDNDLVDVQVLPYFFSDEAVRRGEGITKGSKVTLLGDDRIFEVLTVSCRDESLLIRDDNNNEFIIPWGLVRPLEQE
jgi:hypothetical protein